MPAGDLFVTQRNINDNGNRSYYVLSNTGNSFFLVKGPDKTGVMAELGGGFTLDINNKIGIDFAGAPISASTQAALNSLSGSVSGADLSSYATISLVNGTSGALDSKITNVQGLLGNFYTKNNESGFISAAALVPYATIVSLNSSGANLSNRIDQIQIGTGNFVSNSTLVASGAVLNASIAALSNSLGGYYPITNPSGFISSGVLGNYVTSATLNTIAANLQATGSNLQSQVNIIGGAITNINNITGDFYSKSNPSGFINSGVLGSYATVTALNNVTNNLQSSGNNLQNQIVVVNAALANLNNATGNYYPNTNPSGYINSGVLGVYATVASVNSVVGNLQLTGAVLQSQVNGLNSSITNLNNVTGGFYPNSNPSGFINTGALGGYVTNAALTAVVNNIQLTGANLQSQVNNINNSITNLNVGSGALQSQITSLVNNTGSYYPRNSNPSGYLLGSDLVAINASISSTGSNLQTQVTNVSAGLNAFSGSSTAAMNSLSGSVNSIQGLVSGRYIQTFRQLTDANGNLTIVLSGFNSGVIPKAVGIAEANSSTIPVNVQIVGTPSHTGVTFKVLRSPTTSVLGIVVLGEPVSFQCYVHGFAAL